MVQAMDPILPSAPEDGQAKDEGHRLGSEKDITNYPHVATYQMGVGEVTSSPMSQCLPQVAVGTKITAHSPQHCKRQRLLFSSH